MRLINICSLLGLATSIFAASENLIGFIATGYSYDPAVSKQIFNELTILYDENMVCFFVHSFGKAYIEFDETWADYAPSVNDLYCNLPES